MESEYVNPPCLWPHQEHVIGLIQDQPGTMVAHDMGTGKTRTVIEALCRYGAKRILVFGPRSALHVWPEQVAQYATVPMDVHILQGPLTRRAIELSTLVERAIRPAMLVTNYEALVSKQFASTAYMKAWDAIVCDESHRIKAPGGVQSWAVARIGRKARRRICLSGTPMAHSRLDVYAQYRFLDPSIFGTSFVRFRARYARMGGFENRQVIGWQNESEFQTLFHQIAHVVRKRDVLNDLPPFVHEIRTVELGAECERVYRDLERDFFAEVDAGTVTPANALVKALRLQQATSGHTCTDDGAETIIGRDKLAELERLIGDDLPPDEPVVVFCRFRQDLARVKTACTDLGRQCFELSGSVDQLLAWQSATGNEVIAVQVQSGSEGVDLTRACYAVYYSLGFSLGQYEQSLARLDRPGQTRPVTYVHLLASGTIDVKVHRAFRQRKDAIEAILQRVDVLEAV